MSNYYNLRTAMLFNRPISQPDLGSNTSAFGNLYLSDKIFINNNEINPSVLTIPRVSSIVYAGVRTTANVSGNETLTVNGTGFDIGAVVLVDNRPVDITTFVSNTELSFVTPIRSSGTYSLFVVNSDGSTGASSTGITYAE